MTTMTQEEVSCPKCGGRMWDNRLSKKNPKAPDYKCRSRGCDGVVWPPKGQQNGNARPAPQQSNARQGFDVPPVGNMPYDEPPPVEMAYEQTGNPIDKLNAVFALYSVCFDHALQQARKAHGMNPDVSAIAATLFIRANELGIHV